MAQDGSCANGHRPNLKCGLQYLTEDNKLQQPAFRLKSRAESGSTVARGTPAVSWSARLFYPGDPETEGDLFHELGQESGFPDCRSSCVQSICMSVSMHLSTPWCSFSAFAVHLCIHVCMCP